MPTWTTLVLAILLLGCSRQPTATQPPKSVACGARQLASEDELVGCITQDALWNHMVAWQQIADANPGPDGHPSRNAGEPGYLASVNYAADLLRAAGYAVTIQPYTLPYYGWASTPMLSETSPAAQEFALGADWQTSYYSGSGDVTAPLQPVGGIIIPAGAAPNTSSSGCTADDFVGFTPGSIALIQRGTCSYSTKLALAAAAGAPAAIIFNEGQAARTAASVCGQLSGTTIPVACLASYAVGAGLYQQAQAGPVTVHLRVEPIIDPARTDYNLIADSPYGDPDHVVVVDAHLDAIYGAGMLDNASGSATILEIALNMAGTPTQQKLRYIWFGGEELGLLGSYHYTQHLPADELAKIVFDVDADVTATPNYVYAIADPANSRSAANFPAGVIDASERGNQYFVDYFTRHGLPYSRRSNDGTDSYAFAFAGVPNTGVLTGQDCCKGQADVDLFGGFLGNYEGHVPGYDGGFVDRPFLWGDNLDNNDPAVLTTVSKAVAAVVYHLANDPALSGGAGVRRAPVNSGLGDSPAFPQGRNRIAPR